MSDDLEKEFNASIEKINSKLKEAGKLINDANDMAKKIGLPGLNRDAIFDHGWISYEDLSVHQKNMADKMSKIDIHYIESAMDEARWQTSSWSC